MTATLTTGVISVHALMHETKASVRVESAV